MGLFSGLFGSNKSSTESKSSINAPLVTQALTPTLQAGGQAGGMLGNILGGGWQGYKKDAGMDWAQQQGAQGITGNAAARGLLRSGATGKALVNYGNQSANQYYGDFISKLLAMAGLGTQTGNSLLGAGATGTSKSKDKNGLGNSLFGLALGA